MYMYIIHGGGGGRDRKRRGLSKHKWRERSTNLIILGILDGLWSVPDEQLECLQIVHHGCPVQGCASIVVCGCYVSTFLNEELEHVLVDDLDCGHEWSDPTV